MTTTRLLMIFVPLVAVYSVLLLVSYRPLTQRGVRLSYSMTPVETTTAAERSRGESSFVIRQERRFGITPGGFFLLAILGYIAFAFAFILSSRSGHI
jgi:hypothetical protein